MREISAKHRINYISKFIIIPTSAFVNTKKEKSVPKRKFYVLSAQKNARKSFIGYRYPSRCYFVLHLTRGELYKKRKIVGLHLCVVRRTIAPYSAAFLTSVHYYISLFSIGKHLYGAKLTVTLLGSVAGVFVNVE